LVRRINNFECTQKASARSEQHKEEEERRYISAGKAK
jgi:hypothetical protein